MFDFLIKRSELCLELLKAVGANSLVVEVNNVVGVSAEYAGGLVFLKDDLIVVGKDLNGKNQRLYLYALHPKMAWKSCTASWRPPTNL